MPEPRPVILNNTPLVSLFTLGRLKLLRDLFGVVFVPPEVRREFLGIDREARHAALQSSPWIRVRDLREPKRARVFAGLDAGESEVLALAQETDARLVVIDEKKARRFAERVGLPVTGTLGLLLRGKEEGLIPTVRDEVKTLRRGGMHLTDGIVQKILRLADE